MIKNKIKIILIASFLYSGSSQARIDHIKYHDYRASVHDLELQKMQDFHLQQAQNKLHKQQLNHAWGDLAYLLCKVPNHHQALQHMVRLAPQLHKEQELHEFITTALNLFPNDAVLHVLYGAYLYNVGDIAAAEQHLHLAQTIESNFSSVNPAETNLADLQ